jgi:pimeloyl-ACP methyl ester carboxylesterase
VVALHGAGYSSGYWDYANRNELSFLELGAHLGFDVLALDRPGYAGSFGVAPERSRLADQADTIFDAIEVWRRTANITGPTFLIGHSVGAALALIMAGHARAGSISAVDVLGVPYRFARGPDGEAVVSRRATGSHVPPLDDASRRAWLYGPDNTFDADLIEYDRTLVTPIPIAEFEDAMMLPSFWPRHMPTIRVPVQYSVAQLEVMQESGESILHEVRQLLANSPLVATHLQRHAGHNVSMSYVATAYHLRAYAFFAEAATPVVRDSIAAC